MKKIREARMGRPKTYKTGAIVGTYPKKLLYLGFDRGGVDVIPSAASLEKMKLKPGEFIIPDVTYEEIQFVEPGKLGQAVLDPDKKITAVQYYEGVPMGLTLDTKPTATITPFTNFVNDYNTLARKATLPWETVVLDSLTGLTDVVLNWLSSYNPAAMNDARQWAGIAGGKVRQLCLSITQLPCHTIVLLHAYIDKNELTGEITEQPNVYSQMLRDDLFGMFSQVFYSIKDMNGKPKLLVSDKYPVKGIGPRWPLGLPQECNPDFKSIYGTEL